MNYHISSNAWEHILSFLSHEKGLHTKDTVALRKFIEAIWSIARSGCQWRLLSKDYGNWRAVHKRFKYWSDANIWEKLMRYVSDPDCEAIMIDTTTIRAHACSAGYGKNSQDREALGRSRGGFTTKIHAIVDALGNPLKFTLTSGQRHDITQARQLTANISNTIVLADKGYDSNTFIESLESRNCKIVIPPRINRSMSREYDKHIYKERHLIECCFSKIKYFRRIFARFDKAAQTFLSFLNFVGTLIWLR